LSTSDICELYSIRLDSALEKLRTLKARRVLLHAPNGLKPLYNCVANALRDLGVEVFYSSEPGYGSCDIPLEEAREVGVDVIVHIGHEEYTLREPAGHSLLTAVYVPVYYTIELSSEVLSTLYRLLVESSAERVTVSSTLVESLQRRQVARYLEERGLTVQEVPVPLLGCYYSPVVALDRSVDAHVVVSGGVFHPLGLGLVSRKPILVVDPYSQRVWSAREEADRVLKKRFYVLLKAREAWGGRLGVVIGDRPGQYREALVELVEALARRAGFRVYKITSSYTTLERLAAIDNALGLDLYVVTSCPRLPIDDLAEFYKPVLTPGEFIMLARGSEKYIYPW
jgi:2-(3-amino-3-carboxypropyl)histidine synthase